MEQPSAQRKGARRKFNAENMPLNFERHLHLDLAAH
jgi:hypothetical protein